MDPLLTASLRRLEDHYRTDERCLGMYLWGSLGKGSQDGHSDVDAAIVVRDDHYAAVKEEMRGVCGRLCGEIVLWLPEGETEDSCNYAFLFQAEGRLLLYDFQVLKASLLVQGRRHPDRVLFDREGLLDRAGAGGTRPFDPSRLAWWIDNYWVYMYLNGKYFRRGDLYKLLYVQGVLFQSHLRILNALYPDREWTWWAGDVKALPEEKRADLLVYFGAADLAAVTRALRQEIPLFSGDAREACARWTLPYPEEAERSVCRHLRIAGITSE